MSKKLDLAFYLGETWLQEFPCADDLTGASGTWRLGTNAGAPVVDHSVEVIAGALRLKVQPSEQSTAALAPAVYRHELRVVLADGTVKSLYVGSFNVASSLFAPGEEAANTFDLSYLGNSQYLPLIGA